MLQETVATKPQSPVLKRLEVIVDEWSEEKQAFETPHGHTAKVTATETCEWLPGELFLLHRLDRARIENDRPRIHTSHTSSKG